MIFTDDLADTIDALNLRFTAGVRAELADLTRFLTASLDWLMVEHFQFSSRNTSFLATAAGTAAAFVDKSIEAEIRRNLAEESGHAQMYKRALRDIGIEVDARLEFPPTAYFFHKISGLLTPDPSRMLGAMYATETAAIFEHEVFRDISKEVITRRSADWSGSRLKQFHDMHLSGVEQSHKDELGKFLHGLSVPTVAMTQAGGGRTIDAARAHDGANNAIDAMTLWWHDLLSEAYVADSRRSAA